jgi:O-antigen/teichoic acid export membrane protein
MIRTIFRLRSALKRHGVLVRNSSSLAFGTIISGVLGFVYWWLAARSFSPEAIGTAAAFIALMQFIGLIGEFGIGTLLTGEIVLQRSEHRQGLISAAIIAVVSLSLAFGGIALVITELVSNIFATLNPSWVDYLWVLVGCGLTGLAMIVDKAFVGMLQTDFRTVRVLIFAVLKMGLIALVVYYLSTTKLLSSDTAILVNWVASLGASFVLVELLMRWSGKSLIHRPNFKLLYTLKQKAAHHFMLDLSIQAPLVIMPYLVAVSLSPASNAVFAMMWMIVIVVTVVPSSLATVLFPDIQAAPEQYREKMALSLGASILFSLVFGGFIYTYSAEILTIFNPAYAIIGDSHLRFLGFAILGDALKVHVSAAARLNNRMRQTSVWFTVASIIELICATVGCRLGGLEGLSDGLTSATVIDGIMMVLLTNPFQRHAMLRERHAYSLNHSVMETKEPI